jgi:hypothetical protein
VTAAAFRLKAEATCTGFVASGLNKFLKLANADLRYNPQNTML